MFSFLKKGHDWLEKLHSSNDYSKYLGIIVVFLVLLFFVSLFKNISYPLFWNDEGMTVMHGKRVLQYGYPKVHDGKNVVYDLLLPDRSVGLDKNTDAYIGGASWGMYYFAVIGITLAELSDDLYTKTALIRIPFAVMGFAGLALLALLGTQFFSQRSSKTGFLALFALFEVISVPLVLHLREARYYPLTVLLSALTIFIYAQYRVFKKMNSKTYSILVPICLFLLFMTFSPVYFIFLISIVLYESIALFKDLYSTYLKKRSQREPPMPSSPDKPFKRYLRDMMPLMLSVMAVYPLLSFFKTFSIAEEMATFISSQVFNGDRLYMYLDNLWNIWRYFTSFDVLYLAIFLKICLLFCFSRLSGKRFPAADMPKVMFSHFLTIFFVVYVFTIARIPNFPFTRYLITLQPVLALIIILDVALLYNFMSQYRSPRVQYSHALLLIVFTGFLVHNIANNGEYLQGHVYELSHQYQGPLDHLIPYIKKNYKKTDALVIATNYEETSFMYYLDAKVIVGFVGNNLEQDALTIPDIIIYRGGWDNFRVLFEQFFRNHAYQRISFPVLDYMVNNIPELNTAPWIRHQFKTLPSQAELTNVALYVRK